MEEKKEVTTHVKGIAISLVKRESKVPDTFKETYKYSIFGYYDYMNIVSMTGFGKVRPAKLAEIFGGSDDVDLNDGIMDRYVLKAIEYPLKNGCSSAELIDNSDAIDAEYPFVSCIMCHISREAVESYNVKAVLNRVATCMKKVERIKFGVYFSIGYSDVIILIRSRNFYSVSESVSKLNRLKGGQGEKIISEMYTIVGYERKALDSKERIEEALNDAELSKKIGFSISLSLKTGFSFTNVKNLLSEQIETTLNKIGYSHKDCIKYIHATFGNTDIIIDMQLPAVAYVALYSEEYQGPFYVKSKFFKGYITSINVSVLCDTENRQRDALMDEGKERVAIKKLSQYNTFLNNMCIDMTKQNLPKRISASIVQVMKLYKILAEQNHGFEVRYIIGNAFDAFMANVDLSLKSLENKKGLERANYIGKFEKAVGAFRTYIVTYLSDLYRSEKSFIEGRTMTHPSIGTLTKLLFAYNEYINSLAEAYNVDGDKYAFVVVSGGCDQTRIDEVFKFLGGWNEDYHHLFIISIPEISLFDVGGTLFRLSHEAFHCIGNRYRAERKQRVIYAWVDYIAEKMSEKLFNTDIYKLKDIKLATGTNVDAVINKNRENFCKFMKDEIKQHFGIEKTSGRDEKDLYVERCVDRIKQAVGAIFTATKMVGSTSYQVLLEELLKAQSRILKTILDNTTSFNSTVNVLGEMLCQCEHEIETDSILKDDILFVHMFDALFSSVVSSKAMLLSEKLYEDETGLGLSKEYGRIDDELCGELEHFPEWAMEAACECFADCTAIKALDVRIEEFLLAFIYEIKDIDKAMPMNANNILRIGADIYVMFSSKLKNGILAENSRGKLKKLYDSYKEEGFKCSVDIEEYINRINELLVEYKSVRSSGKEIEEYLKCCKQSMAVNKEITELYNDLRDPSRVGANIDCLWDLWRQIASKYSQDNGET